MELLDLLLIIYFVTIIITALGIDRWVIKGISYIISFLFEGLCKLGGCLNKKLS